MPNKPCEMTVDAHGVARIRLNQPESRNALSPALLKRLGEMLNQVERDSGIRSVELCATGQHFCSGMDLRWLNQSFGRAGRAPDEAFHLLGKALYRLHDLNKPTVAIVQGAAYGGGAGLVCCCDVAFALPGARFSFPEVQRGLIPSIISPFVIQAIGERIARRYFLTGEVIDAGQARRIGLVHEVLDGVELSDRALELHRALGRGAPQAIIRIKNLLTGAERLPLSDATLEKTVDWLKESWNAEEAREGVSAFFEKRAPNWMK